MKIRKAILTGGGRATRLHPITTTINKHLLPLANKPMIFHAIEKVVQAGIREIFINVNPGEKELQQYVGDGGHWGIRIQYYEQTGGPQGIAHVVKEAEQFIGKDPFLYYLSDNIILGSLGEYIEDFHLGNYDAMIALSQVEDASSFGVPVFNDSGVLINTIEKPRIPPNNYAITGIYIFGPKIFFKAFEQIERSARGEYEIPSIYSYLLQHNYRVGHKEITGWWKDTGKTDDLLIANQLLLDQMGSSDFPHHGSMDSGAACRGNVRVGIGSRIGKGVVIKGPVIIGENCLLEDCQIGPYVTVGAGTQISRATVENSLVLENVTIDCPIVIVDSLIGKQVVIRDREKEGDASQHRLIVGDKTVIEFF